MPFPTKSTLGAHKLTLKACFASFRSRLYARTEK
jgi:hypothetical protein